MILECKNLKNAKCEKDHSTLKLRAVEYVTILLKAFWNLMFIETFIFFWSTALFSFKEINTSCLDFQQIGLHEGSSKLPVQLHGLVSHGKLIWSLQLEWFIFFSTVKRYYFRSFYETNINRAIIFSLLFLGSFRKSLSHFCKVVQI